MKKLITAALLIIVMQAQSQTFEGTVKFSMKAEITDPKMKAQMEQAQKQMNDPANQAKMKEMQDKMNDPQMKAMMDANPQMKTAMENAMKMQGGGGANPMAGMMPSGFLFKIKGGNTLTIIEGGMMPMDACFFTDSWHTDKLGCNADEPSHRTPTMTSTSACRTISTRRSPSRRRRRGSTSSSRSRSPTRSKRPTR